MPRQHSILVAVLILIVGVAPVALYWLAVGRAPTIAAEEARALLADPAGGAILVDVRPRDEYKAAHLAGAVSWPIDEIRRLRPGDAAPAQLAGHRLLLICNSGWNSGRAALALQSLSIPSAFSVRGGMQEWSTIAGPACPIGMVLSAGDSPRDGADAVAFRPSAAHEQWAAVLTGFAVKPAYMLLSVILVIVLWRRREADLVALRWAMVFFFLGEAFCAANYLIYFERSYLFENLHSYGMVLSFGFTAYAAMEAIDSRIVHFSHEKERCAFAALCRGCIKHAAAPCGLRRVFLMLIPATAVVALIPLCAPVHANAYATRIFSTTYSYLHSVVHQRYEIRYLPLVAIALCAAAWLVLLLWERHPAPLSRLLYAAALGALGFSLFRLILVAPFVENQVWFAFWEEITELLFLLATIALLLIFRRALFVTPAPLP